MRVHRNLLQSSGLGPNIFRDHKGAMSTDWAKYATPEETRQRARNPADNAVVELPVGGVRHGAGQGVEHDPLPDNRAHTNVIGDKTPEARIHLLRLCRLVIPLATGS
jgi:hypothetical protein